MAEAGEYKHRHFIWFKFVGQQYEPCRTPFARHCDSDVLAPAEVALGKTVALLRSAIEIAWRVLPGRREISILRFSTYVKVYLCRGPVNNYSAPRCTLNYKAYDIRGGWGRVPDVNGCGRLPKPPKKTSFSWKVGRGFWIQKWKNQVKQQKSLKAVKTTHLAHASRNISVLQTRNISSW